MLMKTIEERTNNVGLGSELLSDCSRVHFVRLYGDRGQTIDINVIGKGEAVNLYRQLIDGNIFNVE